MILFIISFFLVFGSSYFITSLITPRKNIIGAIYLPIIAFAQLVLTFEVLSLFTAIKESWVLGLNLFFFIVSYYLWFKNSKPIWNLDCKDFINRVKNSFKLDKSLIVLFIGYCILITTALILCFLLPITNADAQGYHVARSIFWVLQGSLNHFDIADIRNLCLPINSEILYTWVILFVKKDVFLSFFSFVGYVLSIISIYNILGYLHYCVRKRLWVIFILSSFASVLVQISGTETDIIIAGLVSSSIFLFWYALKHNKITPIYLSSLAYALAIGTKTTAIIAIPGVGLFLIALSLIFKKYKPLALFLSFGLINFLIFASYNYILNFLQFGNFMGSDSFIVVSKNYYGLKGMIANFIKYIFMFFDFTGFTWSRLVAVPIINFKNLILTTLHLSYIKDGIYTVNGINNLLAEPLMSAGILGFLVFLPCLFWALIKPIFKFKSKKTWFIFAFAILFIINLLVMSYLLVYMAFSVRFVMSFIVLSSPVLIYSYLSRFNPLKYVIVAFAIFYLALVSTHLWARPFVAIVNLLRNNSSISEIRERAICRDYFDIPFYMNPTCVLRNDIVKYFSPKNKILVFFPAYESAYTLKILEFRGYKIDFKRMENIKNIDIANYNVVITPVKGQNSTLITDYEKRKDDMQLINDDYVQIKKNLVPCFYDSNNKIVKYYKGKKTPPFDVLCVMSQDYLDQNHLKLVGLASVARTPDPNSTSFYIYENELNPIIPKN